jgi:hypothetical protein
VTRHATAAPVALGRHAVPGGARPRGTRSLGARATEARGPWGCANLGRRTAGSVGPASLNRGRAEKLRWPCRVASNYSKYLATPTHAARIASPPTPPRERAPRWLPASNATDRVRGGRGASELGSVEQRRGCPSLGQPCRSRRSALPNQASAGNPTSHLGVRRSGKEGWRADIAVADVRGSEPTTLTRPPSRRRVSRVHPRSSVPGGVIASE